MQSPPVRAPVLRELLAIAVLAAALVGVLIWNMLAARDTALQTAVLRSQRLAQLYGQQASRVLSNVELGSWTIARESAADGFAGAGSAEALARALAETRRYLPDVLQIRVYDRDGALVADSGGLPAAPASAAEAAFFRRHRDQWLRNDLAPPEPVGSGRRWALGFSSSIDAAGTFLGVVQTLVDPAFFEDFHASDDAAGVDCVALIDAEDTVFAAWPCRAADGSAPFGRPAGVLAAFAGIPFASFASQGLRSFADGPFIVSVYQLPVYPLRVAVASNRAAALAGWCRTAEANGAIIAGIVLGTVLFGLLILRQERRRAALEASLRESGERFRVALLNSPITVSHLDRALRYLWIANPPPELAGRPVIGRRDDELLPPAAAAELVRFKQGVLDSGSGARQEIRLDLPGRRVIYDVTAEPLRNAAGAVVGITAAAADITGRRQTEAALVQSERRFREFVEQVQLVAVSLDRAGRITFCNDFFLALTGWQRAEVIGRDWFTTFIPPEDRERVREAYERLLTHGVEAIQPHFENEILTHDRERRMISWDDVPMRDPEGRVIGVIGAGLDITERRQAEAELRRLNAELDRRVQERTRALRTEVEQREEAERATDTFFTMAADLLCIAGADGYFRRLSDAWPRTLGWTMEELLATPFLDFVHPEDVARTVREMERLRVGYPALGFENRYRCRDGSYRLLQWTTTPVQGGLLYGVARDLTEHRQQEEAFRQLQAELLHATRLSTMGEMASHLAHELNQPLTAVANYIRGARRLIEAGGIVVPDLVIQTMDKAVAQALRAGEIIARLREFLRKGESEYVLADINRLVEKAARLGLVGVAARGTAVRFELSPDLPEVLVEPVPIQQVVLNLVKNAVEAMAGCDRRELTIKTALADDGAIRVSVIDTGPGLPRAVAERLFSPYVTTKRDGMGLGLSICHSILKAHGGRISAIPNPEGGTIFRFSLPVMGEVDDDRS